MKVTQRIGTVFLMLSFLMLPLFIPTKTQAANCTVDESNEDVDAGSAALTIRDYGHGQGFRTETINRIKSVRVFLRGFTATQHMTVTVMKIEPTPTEVGSISCDFDPEYYFGVEVNPNYWLVAEWSHGDGLEIEIGEKYAIYLESDGSAMWARSGYNAYSRGPSFKYGAEDAEDDFGFMVCGSFVDETVETSTSTTTTTTTTTTSTTTSEDSSSTTTASSESTLTPPMLETLLLNGESIDLPLDSELFATEEDTLTLGGSAEPNATVVIMVGEFGELSAVADSQGVWEIEVDLSGLPAEDLYITGYSFNEDGDTSDDVDMFVLSLSGMGLEDADEPTLISALDQARSATTIPWLTIDLILLALFVIGVITVIVVVILIKRKNAKKVNVEKSAVESSSEPSEKKEETPSEVPPVGTV
jgi:hypothetical protein